MNDTNKREYKDINKSSLLFKTYRQDVYDVRYTMRDLNEAILNAKSISAPIRNLLLDIYDHILTNDAHLKNLVETRVKRVLSMDFVIKRTNGSIDENVTAFFKKGNWFRKLRTYILEAIFWGNSLIDVDTSGKNIDITLLPRKHVIPEFQEYKDNEYDIEGIDYSVPAYYNRLIEVNNKYDSRDLGELIVCAGYSLMKSEGAKNNSKYIERFGNPSTILTTDEADQEKRIAYAKAMQKQGSTGVYIKGSNTDLEFEQTNGGSQSTLFSNWFDFINSELSKAILGVTMTVDDGSSRAQSDNHEKGSALITKADITFLEDVINDRVFSLLYSMNLIKKENYTFEHIEKTVNLTIDEQIRRDQFLIDNFNIEDVKMFEENYKFVSNGFKNQKSDNNEELNNEEEDEN